MLVISRTPLREAIKRLLLEGLLERTKGQGHWCALPGEAQVCKILDLRLRLEAYAARRAAARASPQQIMELQQSAARMILLAQAEPPDEKSIVQIDKGNARFHTSVIEASQSQRLMHLIKAAVDISLVSRTFRSFTSEQRRRPAQHHVEIAAGSPRWAERTREVHILSAAETFDPLPPAVPRGRPTP